MTERETAELDDARNWDLDNPERSGPVRNRRTVVSVSLPSDVFQVVAAAAQEAGLSTSQFLREAAVAKASPAYVEADLSWAGSSGSVVSYFSPRPTTGAKTADGPLKRFIAENAEVYAWG